MQKTKFTGVDVETSRFGIGCMRLPVIGGEYKNINEKEAIKMIRKHRLWELFLNKTLGLSKDQVHDEAEKLEHATSDLVLEALNVFLASPDTCPHGKAIPK